MLGLIAFLLPTFWITGDARALGVLLLTFVGFMIGLYDDLKKLGGVQKVFLLLVPGLVIVIAGLYNPRPVIPFIGPVRLTIIYPLLLILASTIMANGVNMIDVFNGLVSSSLIIATIPILLAFLLKGDTFMATLALGYMTILSAFYLRHRHPSKIFPGDSGSMVIGLAYLGLLIEGGVEVLGMVALFPMFLNGFFILSSIGGFIEHGTLKERPTEIVGNDVPLISANRNSDAPLTLTRFLVWGQPLSEKDLVYNMLLLFTVCAALSVLTLFLGGTV